MKKFWTVFLFHLREGLLAKTTIIMSTILFILFFGFFGIQHFLQTKDQDQKNVDKDKIVYISKTNLFPLDIEKVNAMSKTFTLKEASAQKEDSIKKEIKDDKVDGLIVISDVNNVPSVQYIYKKFSNDEITSITSAALQQEYINYITKKEGIPQKVAAQLQSKVSINEKVLTDPMTTIGITYVFGIFLYMFLLLYGNMIATGIVAEKSSRVMEVIIPKVKPIATLYARVFAVFCIALFQLSVLGIAFLLAHQLGWIDTNKISFLGMFIDISSLNATTIITFITYFLLGYLLYGMLYAAIGSVVSRTEDLQMTIMPIMMLVMAGFFISISGMGNPNSTLLRVSSYIPFLSPQVTFTRFVAGETSGMEIGLTILILVLSIMLIAMLAGRVYVNGVMFYSEKVKWKDILKLVKKD
ncbi:ABC transporter permease [Bacillus sp. RG28]|uniref:ABC transporter permease n=1 Tax=Gottfriedia endophytica TaxID=2820819 RepID=A0A940NM57_9BACI|nr:ABC transporter permease [Gottfriedia endophytica]MBP0723983.1 ABC transporter permease [Gottfriedia endophytica]